MDLLIPKIARNPEQVNLSEMVRDIPILATIQVAYIGADGWMVSSSFDPKAKRVDLSDREHFRVHIHGKPHLLFVGKPVIGRVTKKATIQLSERIEDAHGKFLGVLVMSVVPGFLTKLNTSVYLGGRGLIVLGADDGILRAGFSAAHQDGLDGIAKPITDPTLLALAKHETSGNYIANTGVDQVTRVSSFVRIAGYPLFISVGIARDDVLASHRSFVRLFVLVALLATVFVSVLAFYLGREIRIGAKRELELSEAQEALRAALARAESAMRANQTFFAMMSHEIRNPLNGLLGISRSLLRTSLNPAQFDMVRIIRDSGTTLLRILNDVLDLTRLETAKNALESENFSLFGFTKSVAEVFEQAACEKGLQLVVDIPSGEDLGVIGDAGRLRQVLWNLTSNAVKFTERGSITIGLRLLEQSDFDVRVQWFVRDTGIGIAPAKIGELFADFVQADQTIHRRFGGSGLGLAISKRLITNLGGSINVSSTPGEGSEFTVEMTLPIGVASTQNADNRVAPESLVRAGAIAAAVGRHALVVDDDPVGRAVMSEVLQDLGMQVDLAPDGHEGLTLATQRRYDIIFMDVRMPQINGLDATRQLRASEGLSAHQPVIGVTANVFEDDLDQCRAAGMNDVLAKPLEERALFELILRALPAISANASAAPSTFASTTMPPDTNVVQAKTRPNPIVRLAPIFLETTPPVLADLVAAHERYDQAEISRLAHRLRSSSLAIEAQELSEALVSLEHHGAYLSREQLGIVVERIATLHATACSDLRSMLNRGAG
jgi:signal transduction histidine kinase/CheY-like chemotaxis protein/HPt (histidine-containing phosphotransfer) domain-containing protein